MSEQINDNREKAAGHMNKFMDSIYEDLENKAGSAVNQFEQKMGTIDERFTFIEGQVDKLRSELGSCKQDVARGNGQLKTFTVPKKKGIIKYIVNGEAVEASVDEKGNVTGKYVTSHDIKNDQVVVAISHPLDNNSAVSFHAGNIKELVAELETQFRNMSSLQKTMNETIVNVQKNFKDSIDSVKRKLDEFTGKLYKEEIEQLNEKLENNSKKMNMINKKLVAMGNVLKEEGLKA